MREAREMALELERLYVETIVEATGLEPELEFPLEGTQASAPAAPPPPTEKLKGGLLSRLFGKG